MSEQANAQTKILERDINQLHETQKHTNERLDRHLEIYAQNGKELSRLATSVDNLRETYEKRNSTIDIEQANQWREIRSHDKLMQEQAISINTIATKTALWATLGSTAASAIVVFLIMQVLTTTT